MRFINHYCFHCMLDGFHSKGGSFLPCKINYLRVNKHKVIASISQITDIGVADIQFQICQISSPDHTKCCSFWGSFWTSSGLIFDQSIQQWNHNEISANL